MSSFYYMGEYVDDAVLIRENVEQLHAVIEAAAMAKVALHVSVDPTQVGSMLSWELCDENTSVLARAVAAHGAPGSVLMLDMEDASVTKPTLALYHKLRERDLPVAVTVQAYLRRSRQDVER